MPWGRYEKSVPCQSIRIRHIEPGHTLLFWEQCKVVNDKFKLFFLMLRWQEGGVAALTVIEIDS